MPNSAEVDRNNLYICLISVHGLIRGHNLELGRDADTGGQTKYVVELARALGRQPNVARVDLLTRRVVDPSVSPDYAEEAEALDENVRIVRINAGSDEYIHKEALWDHLDAFVDNALVYLRQQEQLPEILHSHYADAGYVGSRLSHILGVPLIHTGHSLGRVKRFRLLASGLSSEDIETRYNMARRIDAEELTLASAERVITSTQQEIEEQYELYDYYQPRQMEVIPPGTDLQRFFPAAGDESDSQIGQQIARFLREPGKPMILALSRPDVRKNIATLVKAYAESDTLRAMANLVIVAGNRDDIGDLDTGAQEVLTDLLLQVDHYDLYGHVAYPKHHGADDVPIIYRIAAATGGVFVNPALTEPFGLTLIEAAATALPIVATEDGGPQDIVKNCRNGILVNPLDSEEMAAAITELLGDKRRWRSMAEMGLKGVRKHYTWDAHAQRYLDMVRPIALRETEPLMRPPRVRRPILYRDRAIFSDLDQNLLADKQSLAELVKLLRENRTCVTFGIATGRRLDSALKVMREYGIPEPDILITSGGTAIHYAPDLTEDSGWNHHMERMWSPKVIRRILNEHPGLELQPKREQSKFKISYYIDPEKAPTVEEISQWLHQEDQSVNVIVSFGQFMDIIPVQASKGLALRYVASRWGIPLDHILVAGGSGADEDMMRGNTLAVVVANRHHEELSQLTREENIYFAKEPYARGIIEAVEYYDFFQTCCPNAKQKQAELIDER